MPELPIGTVTFMVTDIEGSTRHLTELGPEFTAVLNRHHQIMRWSIDAHARRSLKDFRHATASYRAP